MFDSVSCVSKQKILQILSQVLLNLNLELHTHHQTKVDKENVKLNT